MVDEVSPPRVVDDYIQASKPLSALFDHGSDLLVLGHIASDNERFGTELFGVVGCRLGVVDRSRIVDYDVEPSAGKLQDRGTAHTCPAAGNKNDALIS
jgi:hypothetical protein